MSTGSSRPECNRPESRETSFWSCHNRTFLLRDSPPSPGGRQATSGQGVPRSVKQAAHASSRSWPLEILNFGYLSNMSMPKTDEGQRVQSGWRSDGHGWAGSAVKRKSRSPLNPRDPLTSWWVPLNASDGPADVLVSIQPPAVWTNHILSPKIENGRGP